MTTQHPFDETIFAAALEKPAGPERAAFLDEACAGDAALRARIEALLRAHVEAANVMATSAFDPPAETRPMVVSTEKPGDHIGLPAVGSAKAGRYKFLQKNRRGRLRHRYLEKIMPSSLKRASSLMPLALILASCGLTGCASLGGPGSVAVAMLGVGIAASGRKADQFEAHQQLKRELEAELRKLLPPTAHATTPDANRLSVMGTPGSITIQAFGDFEPESTRRFIAGARTLAWRHAFDLHVEIFTVRRNTGAAPEVDSNQPSKFFLSLWGYTKVERCRLSPRTEVDQKLGPLLPRSATHAKNIWGSDRSGAAFLVPGKPLIVAGADFSPTTAREFIDQAKLAFPGIAIAVYRDVTKARDGWQPVANYDPTTRP